MACFKGWHNRTLLAAGGVGGLHFLSSTVVLANQAGPCAMSNNDNHPNKSTPTVDELPKNARRHGLLTCTSGAAVEPIEVADSVVLGADPGGATVVLPADVAPQHARVWSTAAGAFLLEDLGSASGTYVNEVRVQRRTLMLGDRIRLGATLVFEFTF